MAGDWNHFDVEEPRVPWWRGCLWRVVTLIVVVSLLGTTMSGLVWLWQRRQAQPPVVPTATPVEGVVAAVVPTAVSSPTPPPMATALPTVTPDPDQLNRIVFVNPDNQIVTIAPDGSEPRLLTNAPINFRFPTWSPDGKRVAAIGNGRSSIGVYVVESDQTVTDPDPIFALQRGGPIYLYWAPDSQQVSFIASDNQGMGLHLAPADGSSESRILANGQPLYWRWTDDGSQILLSSRGRLSLLDINDGSSQSLANLGRFQSPDISADSRFLAFAAATRIGRDSRLVLRDTLAEADLDEAHEGRIALGWSPTANQLAYISPQQDADFFFGPLRLLDGETGAVQVLSEETVLAFFWSPNGRYIAYLALPSRDNQLQAQSRRRQTRPVQQPRDFRLNLSLIDVETGTGLHLLQFEPTTLFFNQFLPFFDQYGHSHHLWSPDSSALVLPIDTANGPQIAVIPRTGGRITPLATGSIAFWSPK